uniref:Venom redulysin-related 2 n=1 Tax=Platymeris rhadamanthus TaxID=1134088 RepID=A0A6B9KZA2_PLARH|nr:venom redulysin-related 2 [Platymeris rhadamanthus]
MSKIWLLLLLVAAFQFVHSYPAEYEFDDEYLNDEIDEYLSDEERGRWDIFKEKVKIFAKEKKELAKKWAGKFKEWLITTKENAKIKFKEAATKLHKELCSQQEDVEEYESDEVQDKIKEKIKVGYKLIIDLCNKIKEGGAKAKENVKKLIANIKVKFCAALSKYI